MTKEDSIKDIQERAQEEFERESAGLNIDLSGFPAIRDRRQAEAEKKRKPEKPLAQPYSREYQPRPGALTKSLARMANEIASDKRDPYYKDLLQLDVPSASEETGVCHFRLSETGESVAIDIQRTRDGWWTAEVNGERHRAETRDTLLSAISRTLNNNVHELTDAEKRECSVTALVMGFDAALIRFLMLRTGLSEDGVRSEFGELPLSDRKHRLLCEGVELCWLALNVDFMPGDDWSGFLSKYAAGRNYSVPLLNGARVAYETQRESIARNAILSQVHAAPEQAPEQAPDYEDIDDLNTDDLNALYQRTARVHSKRARNFTRRKPTAFPPSLTRRKRVESRWESERRTNFVL